MQIKTASHCRPYRVGSHETVWQVRRFNVDFRSVTCFYEAKRHYCVDRRQRRGSIIRPILVGRPVVLALFCLLRDVESKALLNFGRDFGWHFGQVGVLLPI